MDDREKNTTYSIKSRRHSKNAGDNKNVLYRENEAICYGSPKED